MEDDPEANESSQRLRTASEASRPKDCENHEIHKLNLARDQVKREQVKNKSHIPLH